MPPYFKDLTHRIFRITWELYKIMIPLIVIVKIIEELGGIELLGQLFAPLMALVGLPPEMGIVWAATMLTNIYGGMLTFVSLTPSEPLSVAQVTVLGTMMLFAHSFPVELTVARRAGVYLRVSFLLRFFTALAGGVLLNQLYLRSSSLQGDNAALWSPEPRSEALVDWLVFQAITLFQVFLIIAALIVLLEFLRWSHIEKVFIWLLQPLLRLLGLDKSVTSMTIIGMTLGLAYGGGLLIDEARHGALTARQIFGAVMLINLLHGLIEDTLLMMLLGAHLSGILGFRMVFSLMLVGIGLRLVNRISDKTFSRHFAQSVQPSHQTRQIPD